MGATKPPADFAPAEEADFAGMVVEIESDTEKAILATLLLICAALVLGTVFIFGMLFGEHRMVERGFGCGYTGDPVAPIARRNEHEK